MLKIPIFVRERLYLPRSPDFDEIFDALRNKCTYTNPDFMKLKAMNRWTGNVEQRVHTWDHVHHPEWGECLTLPRGATYKVREVFTKFKVSPVFIDKRLSLPPVHGYHNSVVLRPDQQRLAEAMFKQENCLIRSPTGSGKTEVSLKVVEWILETAGPVLIVVWETGLMDQWLERIEMRFNIPQSKIGVIGGGKRSKKIFPITVGMQQSLRKQGIRHVHNFGGIIADEVQRFAATTYQHVIDLFPAKYRIGISANETRKDKKEFLIYDMFGQVADEIERATLIERGKILDVTLRVVPTKFDFYIRIGSEDVPWIDAPAETKNFNDLLNSMCGSDERNDMMWQFMEPSLKAGHYLLVITHRVAHARYWAHRIRQAGYQCGLMIGGDKESAMEFDETKDGLIKGTIQAGIGTIQKIGQALDIPRWNRGFVLTPSAGNKQQFEQVIGRLRRTFEGKDDAICYYFWDNLIYPGHANMLKRNYPQVQRWVDGEFLPA